MTAAVGRRTAPVPALTDQPVAVVSFYLSNLLNCSRSNFVAVIEGTKDLSLRDERHRSPQHLPHYRNTPSPPPHHLSSPSTHSPQIPSPLTSQAPHDRVPPLPGPHAPLVSPQAPPSDEPMVITSGQSRINIETRKALFSQME